MTRRGFALLTVLWLLAALSVVAGLAVRTAGTGIQTTRNRVLLSRAAWAREACHEILLARYAERQDVRIIDTIDLGRGTWCRAQLMDAGTKLNINFSSAEVLKAILRSDTLVDAVLDWRDPDDVERPFGAEAAWYRAQGRRLPRNGPLMAVAELVHVRGFDSIGVTRLEHLLTTRGTGQINVNDAPLELVSALLGATPEAVEVIGSVRAVGHRLSGIDELLGQLPPAVGQALFERYHESGNEIVFEPTQFVELAEGGVKTTGLTSRGWLTIVPTVNRLAVIRREME